MKGLFPVLLTGSSLLCLPAQAESSFPEGWHYRISINGPMSTLDSEFTWKDNQTLFPDLPDFYSLIGSPEISANNRMSFADQLRNVKYATGLAFGSFRVNYNRWGFSHTLSWIKVEVEDNQPLDDFWGGPFVGWQVDSAELNVEFESLFADFNLLYRMTPALDTYLGLRWIRQYVIVELQTEGELVVGRNRYPVEPGTRPLVSKNNWVDPVLGVRYHTNLNPSFYLDLKADISGGTGVDYAWQAMGGLGYRVTDTLEYAFGYRAFRYYADTDEVTYKQTYLGPQVQMIFKF